MGTLAGLAVVVSSAAAQTLDGLAGQGPGSLEAERWRPGLDNAAILDVESGALGGRGTAWTGTLGYAFLPMSYHRNNTVGGLVEHRVGLSLGGSWRLADNFRLGVELPVVPLQTGPSTVPGTAMYDPVAIAGLGDLRFAPKYALMTVASGDRLDMAIVGHATIPTALPRHQYIGDGMPTLAVELAVSRDQGKLRWAANAGPRLRFPSRIESSWQGQELGYRAGASYEVGEFGGMPTAVEATVNGSMLLFPEPFEAGSNPAEVTVGGRLDKGSIRFFAMMSSGLVGVGAPLFRGLLGVRFEGDQAKPDAVNRSDDLPIDPAVVVPTPHPS